MIQTLPLIQAHHFIAVDGVKKDESISIADELLLDDVYTLQADHERGELTLALGTQMQNIRVQAGSTYGTQGNAIHLDCCITLMTNSGAMLEALILVEVEDGFIANIYIMPLGEINADTNYRLVGVDRHIATERFAQVACVSIVRGTHITLSDGSLKPVEALEPGDLVMTRDSGPQPLQWIGSATMRATGAFAPVCIRAHSMNNQRDLRISPDTRVLVYQRQDKLGAGRAEIMLRAKDLIDGDLVVQEFGRHIDLYQLLFNNHEIIFAEGQAIETLHLTTRTAHAVPSEVAARLLKSHPTQPSMAPAQYEILAKQLDPSETLNLLKRASKA